VGEEEGQNAANDSRIEAGEGPKRSQRKPGQCLLKSWTTSEMIIISDGLESHI
jgi:hypothetical protein